VQQSNGESGSQGIERPRAPVTATQTPSFLTILDQFKSHVNNTVTLSTGALVLSAGLLKDIPIRTIEYQWILKVSWILFTVSVISGVLYNYVLTMLAKTEECWSAEDCGHRTALGILNFFLHIPFLIAVLTFMVFALLSIEIKVPRLNAP
jgi:hypothetical protein